MKIIFIKINNFLAGHLQIICNYNMLIDEFEKILHKLIYID